MKGGGGTCEGGQAGQQVQAGAAAAVVLDITYPTVCNSKRIRTARLMPRASHRRDSQISSVTHS